MSKPPVERLQFLDHILEDPPIGFQSDSGGNVKVTDLRKGLHDAVTIEAALRRELHDWVNHRNIASERLAKAEREWDAIFWQDETGEATRLQRDVINRLKNDLTDANHQIRQRTAQLETHQQTVRAITRYTGR